MIFMPWDTLGWALGSPWLGPGIPWDGPCRDRFHGAAAAIPQGYIYIYTSVDPWAHGPMIYGFIYDFYRIPIG